MSEELEAALDSLKKPLRRLMELREDKDQTALAADKAAKACKNHELEVFDVMEASPVEGSIKLDLGDPWGVVTFSPRETLYGRIINEEDALDYFEQSAQVDEFTKAKISKKRLHELVRERREQGMDMPPGVDWYPNRGVTITRKKS